MAEKIAEAKKELEEDEVLQNNALLKFYYPNIKPDDLSDEDWAMAVEEMHFVLLKVNVLQKKLS